MQVLTIEYAYRKNLGNYEHEEVKLSASLESGDNVQESIANLKLLAFCSLQPVVNKQPEQPKLEEAITPTQQTEILNDNESKDNSKKKSSKKGNKKSSEESSEKSEVIEASDILEQVLEPKKFKKSEFAPYSRDNVHHKAMLTSYLNSSFPNWQKKEGIKDFSISLEGKDYVDSKGNIVDSFKALFIEFFA
mgnify:CR=1 FL=1